MIKYSRLIERYGELILIILFANILHHQWQKYYILMRKIWLL